MHKDTTKKFKNLAMLTMPALVIGTMGASNQAIAANTVEVTCNLDTSAPTVIATLSSQEHSSTKHYKSSQTTSILSFVSEYFSPESAIDNCQKTATKLHSYYNNNQMNYLASDTIDGKSVVCAVERRGIGCDSYGSEILFYSQNTQVNPTKFLYDLLGSDFKSPQLPSSRTVSRIYTDLRPIWWPF